MESKALSLLGFCSKAGRLSFGFASSLEAINRKKARLIICACDVSLKSQKEITFHAEKSGIKVLALKNTDIFRLSNAVGHKCGILSVNEDGFATALKEEILNDQ